MKAIYGAYQDGTSMSPPPPYKGVFMEGTWFLLGAFFMFFIMVIYFKKEDE
jgi:hypothetical protein